jgi:hypothetical protein
MPNLANHCYQHLSHSGHRGSLLKCQQLTLPRDIASSILMNACYSGNWFSNFIAAAFEHIDTAKPSAFRLPPNTIFLDMKLYWLTPVPDNNVRLFTQPPCSEHSMFFSVHKT